MLNEAAADDARLAGTEQWRWRGRLLQRAVAKGGEDVEHVSARSSRVQGRAVLAVAEL